MTEQISPRKKLFAAAAIVLGLSLVPFRVDSSAAVSPNDACADGKCCMELGSVCGDLVGYYDSLDRCNYEPGG